VLEEQQQMEETIAGFTGTLARVSGIQFKI
jgi:hypothetical protein